MNDSDKAIEVFERVRLLQAQVDALKDYILNQPGAPTLAQLDRVLFDRQSSILQDEANRLLSAEFERAVQAQEHAQDMLQTLRDYLLNRTTV
jgi:SMC interacting uncharacterized protein involved in chromosome segregation